MKSKLRSTKLGQRMRDLLLGSPLFSELRKMQREGFAIATSRLWRQRAILRTPAIRTAEDGPGEVRVLTHKGDWLNAMWALKSFYHFSQSSFPLHIHDGGLFESQATVLQRHFPSAHFHERTKTTALVESSLEARGLRHCIDYRRWNVHTLKLFDFYLLSRAERVIVMDSDVLFFRAPTRLMEAASAADGPNVYCRDFQYAYAVPRERMEQLAGAPVLPRANSGIACVAPRSIDFELVDRCLAEEKGLSTTRAVVEQSMHAICSARFGIELLPEEYVVSNSPGLTRDVVAKHYVAFPRPWLYREGMATLIADGFLSKLHREHAVSRGARAVASAAIQ